MAERRQRGTNADWGERGIEDEAHRKEYPINTPIVMPMICA